MKAFAILFAGFLYSGTLLGQGETVRVRAGHSFKEEFPPNLRYRYPEFQRGQIIYANGKSSGFHPFNYDILYGGVMTIQPNGDTIVLADQKDYKYFKIKDALYYRAKADKYIEVLASAETAKLGLHEKFIIKRRDKIANDNYATYVDQVNSVNTQRNAGMGRMVYYQDLIMKKDLTYYIIGKDGSVYKAGKGKFLAVFNDQRERISDYLDKNPVDFKSRNDLMRLFEYCAKRNLTD